MKSDLEKSRANILEKAKVEAKELLENSNRIIEKTIKEIKESQADKGKTKELREEILQFRQKMEEPIKRTEKQSLNNPGFKQKEVEKRRQGFACRPRRLRHHHPTERGPGRG